MSPFNVAATGTILFAAMVLAIGVFELARRLVRRNPEPEPVLLRLGDWVRFVASPSVESLAAEAMSGTGLPALERWFEGEVMLIDYRRQCVGVQVRGEPVMRNLRASELERALCDVCGAELQPGEARRCSPCCGVLRSAVRVRPSIGERIRRAARRARV